MKKLIIISVIFLAVIGAGIYENRFISAFYGKTAERIDSTITMVESEDYIAAGNELDSIISDWEEKKPLIMLFNNHNASHNIYIQMSTARVYISNDDKKDSAAALETVATLVRAAASEVTFLYYNIF